MQQKSQDNFILQLDWLPKINKSHLIIRLKSSFKLSVFNNLCFFLFLNLQSLHLLFIYLTLSLLSIFFWRLNCIRKIIIYKITCTNLFYFQVEMVYLFIELSRGHFEPFWVILVSQQINTYYNKIFLFIISL